MIRHRLAALSAACVLVTLCGPLAAQSPPPPATTGQPPGTMLLTVFLKHDQSKPLAEINKELQQNGYFDNFPPPGVEVVSWYVVMGIGQVVTLRFPAERLREVNVALENGAWGGYRTEFYPTYDYRELAAEQRAKLRTK